MLRASFQTYWKGEKIDPFIHIAIKRNNCLHLRSIRRVLKRNTQLNCLCKIDFFFWGAVSHFVFPSPSFLSLSLLSSLCLPFPSVTFGFVPSVVALPVPSPTLPLFFRSRSLKSSEGRVYAPVAGSAADLQPKSNLVHCCHKYVCRCI